MLTSRLAVLQHGRRRLLHRAPASTALVESTAPALPLSNELPLPVYIEFTDAFEVVYYANYGRFMARGREALLSVKLCTALRRQNVFQHTLSVASCRLASPAKLGDTVLVHTELLGCDGPRLLWRQSVGPSAGGKPHAACDVVTCFAGPDGALLPLPAQLAGLPAVSVSEPLLEPVSLPSPGTAVPLHADELGPSGMPCETAILRMFERNRTEAVGGAVGLSALQASGVLVVVTSIENLVISPARLAAADALSVRSAIRLRRRGQFIVFSQRLLSEAGNVVAGADITCACIDACTMKLCDAPPSLAEQLERHAQM